MRQAIILLKTAFLALMLPALMAPMSARAQGEVCDFETQTAALGAVQRSGAPDDLARLRTELRLRRDLLAATIACDEENLAVRVEALGDIPDSVKSLAGYRRLLEGFADASRYYAQQKESIPNLGLQGTRDAARLLASWRDGTYLPLIAWADNLLLWSRSQEFFERVAARLTQASRLAFSLKLVDQGGIAEKFKEAENEFMAAAAENDAAREALNQGNTEKALGHIKSSLQLLSQTYEAFFELESAVQKIIK